MATARPQAETEDGAVVPLRSSRVLARILDIADDAVISVDAEGRIILFNQGAQKTFGYQPAEALGMPLEALVPERFRKMHAGHMRGVESSDAFARVMAERGEIYAVRKNGEEFPAEASISKIDLEGRPIFNVILRDISARKQIEESLRTALREKEVLLREVHHRVKNNLQVVSSLLNLQARASGDEEVARAFDESQRRVQSMALIHEQLYETSDLANVNFPDYIRQLAGRLFRSYHVSTNRVRLHTDIADVYLGIDTAVPCGLILNELISNSLKHAFPGDREGRILVRVEKLSDGSLRMVVADDGVGLPSDIGFWSTKTLGIRLVRSLVRQLDGEIELGGPPGAEFRIRFSTENRGD